MKTQTGNVKPRVTEERKVQSTEIQTRIDGGMSFEAQLDQARTLIKSGFLPQHVKTPEQALVIMQTGKELGLPPMKAFRSIYVVHGNAGLSSQLMKALCEKAKDSKGDSILEDFDVRRSDDTACHIFIKRRGRKGRLYIFTREEADKACFSMTWKKNENGSGGQWEVKDAWKKQAATMLEWRCTSKGLRREFSDVILGLYTPEEIAHDVELVEAESEGAPAGERVTSLEIKPEAAAAPELEARPVAEPKQEKEEPQNVSDVVVKVDDMDDESIMRWAFPKGAYSGQSLMMIYSQETGNGKPKGKLYLEQLVENPKTGANVKKIIERFLTLMSKEEQAAK